MSLNFTHQVIASTDSAYPIYLSDLDPEKYILPERNSKIVIDERALGMIAAVAIDIGIRLGLRVIQNIHENYRRIWTACSKGLEKGAIIPIEEETQESPIQRVQEASGSVHSK